MLDNNSVKTIYIYIYIYISTRKDSKAKYLKVGMAVGAGHRKEKPWRTFYWKII